MPAFSKSHDPNESELTQFGAADLNTFEAWEVNCLARLFSSLGDPTRITILRILHLYGSLCVTDLAAATQLSVSAVSHQLRLLRDRELVDDRRDGRVVWYSISDPHVAMLLDIGADHAMKDCPKGKSQV